MQPHLFSQGEVDPHEFVGRDDRPINMCSYNSPSIDAETFGEVTHSVREGGDAAIAVCVREGRLVSRDSVSYDKFIFSTSERQVPV